MAIGIRDGTGGPRAWFRLSCSFHVCQSEEQDTPHQVPSEWHEASKASGLLLMPLPPPRRPPSFYGPGELLAGTSRSQLPVKPPDPATAFTSSLRAPSLVCIRLARCRSPSGGLVSISMFLIFRPRGQGPAAFPSAAPHPGTRHGALHTADGCPQTSTDRHVDEAPRQTNERAAEGQIRKVRTPARRTRLERETPSGHGPPPARPRAQGGNRGPTTYPLAVQEQMHSEDGGIAYGHLFVPVQDLEDPAVHGALVDAGRVQAAAVCKTGAGGSP